MIIRCGARRYVWKHAKRIFFVGRLPKEITALRLAASSDTFRQLHGGAEPSNFDKNNLLGQTPSPYDWKADLSSSIEWMNPMDKTTSFIWLEHDDFDDVALDRQTRQALSLLLDQYQGRERKDRTTVQLCHHLMDRLSTTSKRRPSQEWLRIRAHRAHAILRCMELFFLPLMESTDSAQTNKSGFPPPPVRRQTMETPYPTTDTYYKALNMLASAGDGPAAKTVLERMIKHSQMNVTTAGAAGSFLLTLAPTVAHWNQVLSAYAVSSQPKKALIAAELLDQMRASDVILDASSYSNVLRACVVPKEESIEIEEEKRLGSKLATKVFQEFLNERNSQAVVLVGTAHLYALGIRALGQGAGNAERDELVRRAMETCCLVDGCCNNHVLQAFLDVAPPHLQSQLLGPFQTSALASVLRENSKIGIPRLLARLPPEWSQHAQARHRSGW